MALVTSDETRTLATAPRSSEGALPSTQVGLADLFTMAGKICDASGGRVQLVRNESDADGSPVSDAAEFLKLDGRRSGRDIRIYQFIGRTGGEEALLLHFLQEVALPLRKVIPAAYDAIKPNLEVLGQRVFTSGMYAKWCKILE